MAELSGLSGKVPIKFSKRAQRDLYERVMAYKKLAELRGAENAELRELATDACTVLRSHYDKDWFDGTVFAERMRELGIEVDG